MLLIDHNQSVEYIWKEIKSSGILKKDYDIMEIPLYQISEDLECTEKEIINRIDDIIIEFKKRYAKYIADIEFFIDAILIEV